MATPHGEAPRETRHEASRWKLDAFVAAACVLICGLLGLIGQPDWGWSVVMAALLVLRRTRPLVFAAAATTVSIVHLVIESALLLPGDLVLLVAVYSVSAHAHERMRHAGLALGIVFAILLGASALSDGSASAGESAVLAASLVAVSFVTAWAIGLLERRKKDALNEAQYRRLLSERDADAQSQLAAYEERERISDDIHDVLAHTLTGVIIQAESGKATAATAEDADLYETISSSSRTALHEVRNLLAPTTGPGDHPTASLDDLDELLDSFSTSGLQIDFAQRGSPRSLSPGMSLAAFRVIQESLTNALRHGAIKRARLDIDWSADAMTITTSNPVEDESAAGSISEHRGLGGMRRRCEIYGGSINYQCTDHFTVNAQWPLAIEQNRANR